MTADGRPADGRPADGRPADGRPADGRPIGVFDSGVGGLTVVEALTRRLPAESILYLGDTARLPYGTKSSDTVRRYSERNVDFLLARDVKAVVIACNTASALALDHLRLPVPAWGVVAPGAAAAARVSRGRVGVIATESTVDSDAYPRALRRLRPDLEVTSMACPLFVPLVETGWLDDEVTEAVARRYLAPMIDAGVDTLVLGCTHYPLLRPVLARVAPGVTLVDSAETVSDAVAEAFTDGALVPASGPPRHHLCFTDVGARIERLAETFLAEPAVLELVDI